jgi:Trypsin-like peptidase domain/Tetratricopeptide repeat
VIEPAVARIDLEGGKVGTAFAIDRQFAMTAWHCLRDPHNGELPLRGVDLRFLDGTTIAATYERGDRVEDWAILRLEEPLPEGLDPVQLRPEVETWEECRCLGFPAATLQLGELGYLPILATVSGETVREGAPRIVLHAREVGAGLDPSGMSGGPVIPRNGSTEAVGVMSRKLLDDYQVMVGGVLFACPVRLFADKPILHPSIKPDIGPPTVDRLIDTARDGDVAAAAQLGRLLRVEGKPDDAEPWLRQAATAGNSTAAYELGLLLDPKGKAMEHDRSRADEALHWFRKAAIGGDVYGAATMGVRLRQRGEDDAALPWLEEAVERGDAMAAHTLGLIYEDRKDPDAAERWQRFGAERGDQAAARKMAQIAQDRSELDEARHWLELAPNDTGAQTELARLRERA